MKLKTYKIKGPCILPLIVLFTALFCAGELYAQTGNVGIGTVNPEPSAILDLTATDKGILIPRIADTTLVAAPATGLLIYQTADDTFYYFDGILWRPFGFGGPAGANGINGATGPTGPIGADGIDGVDGIDGATGPTGTAGIDGVDGIDGATGPTGLPGGLGLTGPTGPTGPNGTTLLPGVAVSSPLMMVNGGSISFKNAPQEGLILIDNTNNCWELTISATGELTTQSIICP